MDRHERPARRRLDADADLTANDALAAICTVWAVSCDRIGLKQQAGRLLHDFLIWRIVRDATARAGRQIAGRRFFGAGIQLPAVLPGITVVCDGCHAPGPQARDPRAIPGAIAAWGWRTVLVDAPPGYVPVRREAHLCPMCRPWGGRDPLHVRAPAPPGRPAEAVDAAAARP